MGTILILEVENSSMEELIVKGFADSSFDCRIAFEYRGSNDTLNLNVDKSEIDIPTGFMGATHTIIKEVALEKEGVMVIEDLSLNIDDHDCAPYIARFRIQGSNKELNSCGRKSIRCYYDKTKREAIVMAIAKKIFL